MPRRNIYIKKEHESLFEEAEKLSGGEGGLSQTIAISLKEFVARQESTKEMAFKLQLLKELDLPLLNEIAEYRLREFPSEVANIAAAKATLAHLGDPTHFRIPFTDSNSKTFYEWEEWVQTLIWSGIEGIFTLWEDWFSQAEKLVQVGKREFYALQKQPASDSEEGCTGAEANLSGDDQIMLCLGVILANGGTAEMRKLYSPIEALVHKRNGVGLSKQGLASLRFFINTKAVEKHLVEQYNPKNSGWKITEHGKRKYKEWLNSGQGRLLLNELEQE